MPFGFARRPLVRPFDTKARATAIGFEREEDVDAFRREFVGVSR